MGLVSILGLFGLALLVYAIVGLFASKSATVDLASFAVAGATLMLAAFTAFLALETRESVVATRVEAGIAASALEQARKQAEATDRQASIAQQTLEASWRPVLVDVLPPRGAAEPDYATAGATPRPGGGFDFRVRFRNVGSGPAIISRAGIHAGSAGVLATSITSSVVAPDEMTTLDFELKQEATEAHPVIANIRSRVPVTVDVSYGDQGGHHRWVTRAEVYPVEVDTWRIRSVELSDETGKPLASSGPMFAATEVEA
jgi:hypothetical protein